MNYKKLIKKAELLYNNGLIDESIDMYDKSVEKVAKIPQHSYRGRAILVILESLNRKFLQQLLFPCFLQFVPFFLKVQLQFLYASVLFKYIFRIDM
jgi:hypothetical protein